MKKNTPLPNDKYEQDVGNLPCADMKYTQGMDNGAKLKESVAKMNQYMNSHKAKY